MSDNILTDFQQQEAETTAAMIQFNRWSQALIERMIREQEEKMMASDLPVDGDGPSVPAEGDNFWDELI